MEAAVVAALIGLVATLASATAGTLFYVWRRDPAGQRNGVLGAMVQATKEVTLVAERLNAAHTQFLDRMGLQDERNREEHTQMIKQIEQLADILAPRRPRSP